MGAVESCGPSKGQLQAVEVLKGSISYDKDIEYLPLVVTSLKNEGKRVREERRRDDENGVGDDEKGCSEVCNGDDDDWEVMDAPSVSKASQPKIAMEPHLHCLYRPNSRASFLRDSWRRNRRRFTNEKKIWRSANGARIEFNPWPSKDNKNLGKWRWILPDSKGRNIVQAITYATGLTELENSIWHDPAGNMVSLRVTIPLDEIKVRLRKISKALQWVDSREKLSSEGISTNYVYQSVRAEKKNYEKHLEEVKVLQERALRLHLKISNSSLNDEDENFEELANETDNVVHNLASLGVVSAIWPQLKLVKLSSMRAKLRVAIKDQAPYILYKILEEAKSLGLGPHCPEVKAAKLMILSAARASLDVLMAPGVLDDIRSIVEAQALVNQIESTIARALQVGLKEDAKEVKIARRAKTTMAVNLLKYKLDTTAHRSIQAYIVYAISQGVSESHVQMKRARERTHEIALSELITLTSSPMVQAVSDTNVENMMGNIDSAIDTAIEAGVFPEHKLIVKARTIKRSLTIQGLRKAVDKSNIAEIDKYLLLALRTGVSTDSAPYRDAILFKIRKRMGPVDLKEQRAADTSLELVEGLSRPKSVRLERSRHLWFQHGIKDYEGCVECKGTGKCKSKNAEGKKRISEENIVSKINKKEASPVETFVASEKSQGKNLREIFRLGKQKGFKLQEMQKAFMSHMSASLKSTKEEEEKEKYDNDKKKDMFCGLCKGTGKTEEWPSDVLAPEDKDEIDCSICYGPASFGLSTECKHKFCGGCASKSLEGILNQGQFPAICPACRAEGNMKCRILPETLTFLERRKVITRDLQFRFLKQELKVQIKADEKMRKEEKEKYGIRNEKKEKKRMFFKCPNAKCTKYLKEQDIQYTSAIIAAKNGHKRVDRARPGLCPCGALVCLRCHLLLDVDTAEWHDCSRTGAAKTMDTKTAAELKRIGKRCPNCGIAIQKQGGCDIMMCGTKAHGSLATAVANGGCGYQFRWSSLQAVSTTYIGLDGKRKNGIVSAEERFQALKALEAKERGRR
mmetsp:Transcript_16738/g.25184  ORF Transcript_16738/g.25184 Transcript_16738/m.25184 type:complete len:1029 (+) Transcript_16738:23-3109(+)